MLIELFYFEGCPHHEPARELVERLARELRVRLELRLVEVPTSKPPRG